MKQIIKLILVSSALAIPAIAKSPYDLNPGSLTLHEDIKKCQDSGCNTIYGRTTESIKIPKDSLEPIDITLIFEHCTLETQLRNFINKNDDIFGDHLLIFADKESNVRVTCRNRENEENSGTYSNISFSDEMDYNGIKIRKNGEAYESFGYLTFGIKFLPAKKQRIKRSSD